MPIVTRWRCAGQDGAAHTLGENGLRTSDTSGSFTETLDLKSSACWKPGGQPSGSFAENNTVFSDVESGGTDVSDAESGSRSTAAVDSLLQLRADGGELRGNESIDVKPCVKP